MLLEIKQFFSRLKKIASLISDEMSHFIDIRIELSNSSVQKTILSRQTIYKRNREPNDKITAGDE